MRIKLVNGLPVHPHLVHPHTGEPLRAIMIDKRGEPVWPVMGASEDDDSNDDNDDSDVEDADEEDSSKDDKGTEGKKKPAKEPEETDEQKEIKALKKRLAAADRNKEAALKKLRDLENKGKPADEVAKQEAEEAKAASAKREETNRKLALTNAFLVASQGADVSWHDAKVAQAALNLTDVEVDEDGEVTGMEAAVKALIKSKSFLVKPKATKDEDKDEKEDKGNGPSGSGVGTGRGKGKGKGAPDREELIRKYPALRN